MSETYSQCKVENKWKDSSIIRTISCMGKRKNNDIGCIGAMLYIVFGICAIVAIISAMGGIFAIIAIVTAIVFSAKILYKLFKKLYEIIKKKLKEKRFTEIDAFNELEKANKLADITNKTTDRDMFYNSLKEIKEILKKLSKYEDKFNFSYLPSENLRDLEFSEHQQIELLEKRIAEKEKLNYNTYPIEFNNKEELKGKSKNDFMIQNYPDGIGQEYDALLLDAGKIIVDKEKASIGMLQREFKIGFNRANRIMNQLHECHVVSDEIGTSPRKVLMTTNEFDIFKSKFEGLLVYDYKNHETEYNNNFEKQISERIEMYNDKYDYMEGHDFEYYCANILEKNGFNDVEVTPGSGDNGIDIIAYKDYVKYGIQCKCYSSDIGVKAVQEVFAGAKYYDCHVPVVLTNRYFTRQAKELAQKTNVLLWDRDKLNEMIKKQG